MYQPLNKLEAQDSRVWLSRGRVQWGRGHWAGFLPGLVQRGNEHVGSDLGNKSRFLVIFLIQFLFFFSIKNSTMENFLPKITAAKNSPV